MKEIPLTNGGVALIDDEDFDLVSQYNWMRITRGKNVYAISTKKNNQVLMHRLILDPPKGMVVDHQDFNGLNNQRANICVTSVRNNAIRRGKNKNNTTGYRGVFRRPDADSAWTAEITVNRKKIYLGYFYSPEEAAHAYDKAARHHFGDIAVLNFLEG